MYMYTHVVIIIIISIIILYTHTYIYIYIYTCVHTYIYIYMCICIIHIYIYIYIYSLRGTHTHICSFSQTAQSNEEAVNDINTGATTSYSTNIARSFSQTAHGHFAVGPRSGHAFPWGPREAPPPP